MSTVMRTRLTMIIYPFMLILLNICPSLPARFSVIGLDVPLVIRPGEDAVLPCHLSPQINAENMTIRWFKDKYQNLVHLYRYGEDRFDNQMPEYRSRTTLIKDGIIAGRVSLKIHNVRPTDSGLYTCFYNTGFFYEEAAVELKVAGLGSKLQIYLDDLEDGTIPIVCESTGWYPEPEAQWKDENGNNISSSTEVKAMDGSLLFHVKVTYIFNGHPRSLSCCIGNTMLSQWKQSTIHITDSFYQNMSSCVLSRLLFPALFTVLGILLISLAVYFFKKQETGHLQEALGEHLEELEKLPEEIEWRRDRRFATAVTLDPDTAHPRLILSKDGRSLRLGDRKQDLPDTPQRFDYLTAVLGRERLSSGRHYWEVEVGDKTGWALGVCKEPGKRKTGFPVEPQYGFWTVEFTNGKYKVCTRGPTTFLTPRVPSRTVGLFYEACRLSVYNVDDRSLIFTFSGASFSPTLRPYFNPGPGRTEGGGFAWALRILPVTGREGEGRDTQQMSEGHWSGTGGTVL